MTARKTTVEKTIMEAFNEMIANAEIRATIAGSLSGEDIGKLVSFEWSFPISGVKATIYGELRQISHRHGEVHLNLTAPDDDNCDLAEFSLNPGDAVRIKA